jgi:hypothetical protein
MYHYTRGLSDGLTTTQLNSRAPITKSQDLLQRTTGLELEKG